MNEQTSENLPALKAVEVDFEDMPDDELFEIQRKTTALIEERRRRAKSVHIDRIKADMAAHGLTYRDFMVPSVRSGVGHSSRSSGSRGEPKYGINRMLPALGAILKDGPKAQEILRVRMKDEYNLPLDVIGMILRWKYIERMENGDYTLTQKGLDALNQLPPAPAPIALNGTGAPAS